MYHLNWILNNYKLSHKVCYLIKSNVLCGFLIILFFFSKYTIEVSKRDISKFNFNSNLYNLLFIRFLFPSYYFDCYEQVLHDNQNENELIKIISKSEQYILFLKELFLWIKQFVDIPDIEWIIKT